MTDTVPTTQVASLRVTRRADKVRFGVSLQGSDGAGEQFARTVQLPAQDDGTLLDRFRDAIAGFEEQILKHVHGETAPPAAPAASSAAGEPSGG
jgi:hypothetical protein